ncbi:MAG TPA: exosortase family protein XrtF [Cytophagales bacterium]|jgi:exosortase family protein XrtF|nr:exosortase family protein XrtF [Cytophagales bacterium]
MKFNWKFIKENKKAIRFLLVFVGAYVVLNSLYGFYVQQYSPTSDPLTRVVSDHVVLVLRWFDSSVQGYVSNFNEYIAIANDSENMIYVFEGCNSLNVMIVYISFLIAFTGPMKSFFKFTVAGFVGIYLLNLIRLVLLYGVTFYFPDQLYFFHKYLFTGIIYVVVFVFWYFWVRTARANG